MQALLYLVVTAGALAHPQSTIDDSILQEIFGTPPPTTPIPGAVTTLGLEQITVRSTDASSTFVAEDGTACKCVPYYLCDENLVALNGDNTTVTGWGSLDVRFREDECQESVERCCKNPKREEDVPKPTPDASKLKGCGYRNPKGLDFTLTGASNSLSQFGEFPWVVALLDALDGSYAGVGVLIHPQVVMTGAHIAAKYSPGTFKIRAGEWDTQTNKERLQYQERLVQEIKIHPEYRPKSLWNDIALLRLNEPVQLDEHINVMCLPDQDENFESSKDCVANGWGKDFFGVRGRYAVILKRVEIDMVQHQRCNMLLQATRLGRKFNLHNSFVCAGGEEGKDTCQGDGGAPLVCPIGGDRYKLTGLVAWGIGCGQKDVPAVYVNVALFRRWVDSAMVEWGYEFDGYHVE